MRVEGSKRKKRSKPPAPAPFGKRHAGKLTYHQYLYEQPFRPVTLPTVSILKGKRPSD